MRLAARLEAVNKRLRMTAPEVIGTEDADPDSAVSEEPLPARPDPWPGDDKSAGGVRGWGTWRFLPNCMALAPNTGRWRYCGQRRKGRKFGRRPGSAGRCMQSGWWRKRPVTW